jgi:electron transfer flavoprotein alpha/beta subunit
MAREPSGVAVFLRRLQSRPGVNAEDEVLGLCERGALTTALAIAGPLGMAVTAIAVGPARREDRVLAMALRAGCDRALRISDDNLDELDYLGLAQVLAAGARHVDARVVVCGDRSQDEHTGAIGPAVAELLGAAHVTQVILVEVEDGALLVERAGDGSHQRFRVAPPAVLCVRPPPVTTGARPLPEDISDDDARTRRAAALIRVPMIEEIDLARLGVDRAALQHRRAPAGRLRPVRSRRRAQVSATPADLVARLRSDQLIGPGPRRRRASSLSRVPPPPRPEPPPPEPDAGATGDAAKDVGERR